MEPITVVGEALMDIVVGDTAHEIPGGSPANVALGLGRLGVPVEFVTWLGGDERGHRIAAHLRASGVRIAPAAFGAARTSTATVRVTPAGQPAYDFDIEWDLEDGGVTPARVHIGSIAAFLAPGAGKVRDLIQRTASSGGVVSFDPNIRPALLGDPDDARAWFEELARSTTLLKLSDEDAAWLYPGLDGDAVLDRLLGIGVELAVMTSGASGSVLATLTERVRVASAPATLVDTVGAGDTYMAALLWQLGAGGAPLGSLGAHDLITLGTTSARAAAITVGRQGADLPTAADLAAVAARRFENATASAVEHDALGLLHAADSAG